MQHVYASVKPLKLSPRQTEALRIVAAGWFYPCLEKEEDGWHARWRAVAGSGDWVDEYVRAAAMTRLTEDAEDQRHERREAVRPESARSTRRASRPKRGCPGCTRARAGSHDATARIN